VDFMSLMGKGKVGTGSTMQGGMTNQQHAGAIMSGFGQGMTTMDPAVHRAYEQGSSGYANMAHAQRMKEVLNGHPAADPELDQATQDWHNGPKPTSVAPKDIRGGRGTNPTGFDYNSIMKGAN